jgi:hypothetical protein
MLVPYLCIVHFTWLARNSIWHKSQFTQKYRRLYPKLKRTVTELEYDETCFKFKISIRLWILNSQFTGSPTFYWALLHLSSLRLSIFFYSIFRLHKSKKKYLCNVEQERKKTSQCTSQQSGMAHVQDFLKFTQKVPFSQYSGSVQ